MSKPEALKPQQTKPQGLGCTALVRALLVAGWRENGHQQTQSFRIVTRASYPLAGAEIKSGGRQRWIGPDNRRCTIGARTVCFFEMVDNAPANFRNYSVKHDMEKALAEVCPNA
jgi:hypothetical protein